MRPMPKPPHPEHPVHPDHPVTPVGPPEPPSMRGKDPTEKDYLRYRDLRQLIVHGNAQASEGRTTIMASLEALSAKLDELGAATADLAADVSAKFQLLLDAINAIQPGETISQEAIDDLTAKATAVDDAIDSLDAAAEAITVPSAPPVEPPPAG